MALGLSLRAIARPALRPSRPSTGGNSRTSCTLTLMLRKIELFFYAAAAFSTRVLQGRRRTALCKDHVDVARDLGVNPQESDTPQYRYEPNAAATQKSESCGHRVRRSATQHATGGARQSRVAAG